MKSAKPAPLPRKTGRTRGPVIIVLCLLGVVLGGCTRKFYQKSADKEAYRAIAEKSPLVPNMEPNFNIATNPPPRLDELPVVDKPADPALGQYGEAERGSRILPLDRALEISIKNSRSYQTRKEALYARALDLTLTRHRFTPIFSSGAQSTYNAKKKTEVVNGMDQLTDSHSVAGSGNVGMDMLLRTGTQLAVDFTSDFTRFVVGDQSVVTGSKVVGKITQPLLRNAGYKVTMETLTLAERGLLYELRNFTQYRRDYVIQLVTAYFRVLQNRDSARNAYLAYQAFKYSAERTRAFVEVGKKRVSDLGRLKQQELSNETQWQSATRTYKESLDLFKIQQLGLSPETALVLDETELQKLKILHPSLETQDAIRVALANRLDLYNQRDQFEDAFRNIGIKANALKPDLDLVLQGSVSSAPGNGLPELNINRNEWSGQVNVNLPIDRKSQRNEYRKALIAYDKAVRDLEEKVDTIKMDISNGWRKLDEARRNYEISQIGLELSQRRVEEQNLLAELGKGTTEEQVTAQNDLTASLNQRTQQLINHNVNRLSLWRDLGILTIKDNGQWEEISDVKK